MSITKRQKEIIDFISSFMEENEYAPSIAEIQKKFSINSPATIHQHLKNMEENGLIRRSPNRHRSIEVIPAGHGGIQVGVKVPVLGSIAAGRPIESFPDTEMISLPEEMVADSDTFVLKVKGDSMMEDHILDGDMVIVQRADTARPGDKVVALIDGSESTLKRFYPESNRIRLQPANREMEPMYFEPEQVQIQGKVIGILRRF
ncbi:MAG: transcriptional repressor LexA [Nitrospinota bacterium]|nr:transcriptional repressor LexA [Nitrospinota bacterium]